MTPKHSEQATLDGIGRLLSRAIARKLDKEKQQQSAERLAPEQRKDSLLVFIARFSEVNQKQLCEEFGFSRATANRRLRKLLASKVIESKGSTRNKTYRLRCD